MQIQYARFAVENGPVNRLGNVVVAGREYMTDDGHFKHEVPCAAPLVEVVQPRAHGVLFERLNNLVPRAAFAQHLRFLAPVVGRNATY